MEKSEKVKKTGAELLEECKAAKDYTCVGIYDQGEIVMTRSTKEVFIDCTETFALIRKLPAEPLGTMSFGLTVYGTGNTDYDLGRITELSTWQALIKNHFTDALDNPKENALFFALSSRYPIPDEVFDLLYAAYPNTPLEGILYDCKRLDAAKWAVAHGADKFYNGYKYPMQELLAWTKRGPEAEDIYRYLYDADPEDYGKTS